MKKVTLLPHQAPALTASVAVKKAKHIEITHLNLNDQSIEGIRLKGKSAFSVQYHPEATPGPHDSRYLFDEFIEMIKKDLSTN